MDSSTKIRSVRPVAAEDLRVGDDVALLRISYEFPSFLWCGDVESRHQPVRMTFLPHQDVGQPLQVMAICLPFVVVEKPNGKRTTLDLRRCELAVLGHRYAKLASKSRNKN